jgi:hypothetical protein
MAARTQTAPRLLRVWVTRKLGCRRVANAAEGPASLWDCIVPPEASGRARIMLGGVSANLQRCRVLI